MITSPAPRYLTTNNRQPRTRARLLCGAVSTLGIASALVFGTQPASAQGSTNLVGACTGVSLPPSAVTNIVAPVLGGIVTPIQGALNPLLNILFPLDIDVAGLLADAADGDPITLQVLNNNGDVVGANDACDVQADSFQLDTEGGISIGGNRITGLGTNGLDAVAGEANSIAFGNSAKTSTTAVGAVAIGTRASVTAANSVALGTDSVAARGALANYAALGITGTQSSVGEFSVGAVGATRQITNVAAGTQATDAVNLAQLTGVAAQIGAASPNAVLYDTAAHDSITLTGAGGTTIGNVAPGAVATGSTEAINGGQLFATDTNVTNNTTAITNLTNNVQNGSVGTVRYSNAATPTVPNGGVPTNELTLVGATTDPVGLHNVRAGAIAAGSTDAVNGAQFLTLGNATASALGGLTTYDPSTNSFATSLLYDGTQYGSVQAAFGAIDNSINGGAGIRYFRVLSTRPDGVVTGVDSVAIGPEANATAANSVALGTGSAAIRGATPGYTALGVTGLQNSVGEISVGAVGAERQITNVAAGVAATDAVNVAQLTGVATQVGAISANAVLYDTLSHDRITLTGVNGTTIGNVAPGLVSASSTEAVNGAQLFATNGNVTNNTTAITNLTNNVQNGSVGTVRYSNAATPTVPNGGVPTNELTLVGATTDPVGLHNVRAGAIAAGSTDAVNGAQFLTLGNATASALGGLTTYDPSTNSFATSLLYDGTQYGSVQAAFGAIDNSINGGAGIRYFRVLSLLPDGVVTGTDSVAIGPQANAAADNSVALGMGAAALRGATADYTALGLIGLQNSVGEISVGAAGAARQITNVAAGTDATDAVNVGQLTGVAAALTALGNSAVQYDNAAQTSVTLGGAGGTTITNLAAGALNATSSDAVNGAQLYATNQAVAANTTAITNLGDTVNDLSTTVTNLDASVTNLGTTVNNISTAVTNLGDDINNGAIGTVQYSNPDDPTTPNGGVPTNDLTLVGATAAPVGLHNVAAGSIAAGSTDAVNGGQIFALAQASVNAVTYDTDVNGVRTNTVTFAGGNAAAPVTLANVAAGALNATSTEAVNGAQLFATNQNVAAVTTTANTALTLGQNSVQYDASRTEVTFNGGGSAVTLHNVAAGVSGTDAVNVSQLNTGINSAVTQANSYTDSRIAALDFDLRTARRDNYAGTSAALAAAGLPQAYEAGKGMIAIAGGTYQGQSAVALGFSKAFNDGSTVVKLSGSYDSRGRAGASGGIGYQF